jgi:hypothetical protein
MTLWALNVFSDGVVLGVRHFVYRYLLSDSASEERNGLSSDNTCDCQCCVCEVSKMRYWTEDEVVGLIERMVQRERPITPMLTDAINAVLNDRSFLISFLAETLAEREEREARRALLN